MGVLKGNHGELTAVLGIPLNTLHIGFQLESVLSIKDF